MKQNNSFKTVYAMLVIMAYTLFGTSHQVMGQRLIDQTYMNTMTFSNKKTPANFNFTNGNSFRGTKVSYLTNGRVTDFNYLGTIFFANGDKLMTCSSGQGFDSNFNPKTDNYYYLTASGTLYNIQYRNGVKIYEQKINRKYYIQDNCINFYAEGYYGDGGYSDGNTSSSGSNSGSSYNRHSATCRGCNGNGKCQHCHGRGWVNNIKCSLCNGNGICKSCAGVGKIYGSY